MRTFLIVIGTLFVVGLTYQVCHLSKHVEQMSQMIMFLHNDQISGVDITHRRWDHKESKADVELETAWVCGNHMHRAKNTSTEGYDDQMRRFTREHGCRGWYYMMLDKESN